MRRRVAVIVSVAVTAAGITLATPGLALAQSSCTGTSSFYYDYNGLSASLIIPTIGNNTSQDNCDLGYGNISSAVKDLQVNINFCYGTNLATDGVYGTNTENAVKSVQRQVGVTVDGVYGPQTRNAMTWQIHGILQSVCGHLGGN